MPYHDFEATDRAARTARLNEDRTDEIGRRIEASRRTFLKGSAAALTVGALSTGVDQVQGGGGATASEGVATARSAEGMVASVSPDATAIGAEVLRDGGNAVDAAVAVQFALNVVQPHSSGIGGGGFMLVYDASEDEVYSIDNRERAPFGATPDMFLEDGEEIPFEERITRGQAVGVPGTLKACDIATKRFGSRELSDLIDPAISLAEEATVDAYLAETISEEKGKFNDAAQAVFTPGGDPLEAGESLKQPDLADTFRLIADEGIGAFYKGPIGAAIADVVQERGGSMTTADLGAYNVTIDIPEYSTYGDVVVRTQSLPSSGGLTIAHILALLEGFDIEDLDRDSADVYHLLAESFKLAFADRGEYMGDSAFVDAPWQGMGDPEYLTERRESIDERATTEVQSPGDPWSYQPGDPYEIDPLTVDDISEIRETPRPRVANRGQTTHFTVADGEGNLVSWTSTIEQLFGSGIMVPGYGVMLNNELTDFDAIPGGANEVQPLKRPLSSTSPTIVFRDGSPLFTVGSPGGPTIITTVSQVILNLVAFGLDPQEAVAASRIYADADPTVFVEETIPEGVRVDLESRGHELSAEIPQLGNVQLLFVDPDSGEYVGVGDARRDSAVEAP